MPLAKSLVETPLYDDSGSLTLPWIKHLGRIGDPMGALNYGTSTQRAQADTSTLPDGYLWYETDTDDIYRLKYDPSIPGAKWVLLQAGGGGGEAPGATPPSPPVVIPPVPASVDAPPVSISRASVREVYNHEDEIDVYWDPDPGATADNFRGCAVFLEDPDISSAAEAPMDGSIPLDGSSQTSGQWKPERESDSFKSPAVLKVPSQDADRDIRVYLAAFGPQSNYTLNRANEPSPTPNVKVNVPARSTQYVSGQEYAWLVTGVSVVQVDDFDNEAGPKYHLIFDYTKPDPSIPLPPGMGQFGGVEIIYQYDPNDPSTQTDSGIFLPVDEPGPWTSPDYDAAGTGTFQVWFVSRDVDGHQNSIVTGVTPEVDVTVTYPPVGEPTTPGIENFVITPKLHESQPDGTIYAIADADWTVPDSPRYAMTMFWRVSPLPVRQMVPPGASFPVNHLTFQEISWPKTPQDWTIAAIPSDYDGHSAADPNVLPLPSYIPTATWHIGPPGQGSTGGEFISGQPGVAGVTVSTPQKLSSNGVRMMQQVISGWTNPTDNGFGGVSIVRVLDNDLSTAVWWDAPANATSITTDWEPAPPEQDFVYYFVSRNLQNQRNSVVFGFTNNKTYHFVPMEGRVIPSRYPADWFSDSEFAWPAGGSFQAQSFSAQKIFVGSILRVGGGTITGGATPTSPSFGGQQNGQIAVYNSANVLRAWMGEQINATPDNPTQHAIYGGWFAELYVGGSNPTNAPLYANNSGAVIVGGQAAVAGQPFPYISIKNDHGFESGRVGAALGYPEGVPASDQAYIGGAWFREFALGGTSLASWQVLLTVDPSKPNQSKLQMRDISNFTIDYAANYNDGSAYTLNAANRLQFGYEAYLTGIGSQWKFPGISLFRKTGTGGALTTHGIQIVNRGVVISGPQGKLGSFVTYNDDTTGGDGGTFYPILTMGSPLNIAIPTVQIAGGTPSSGAGWMQIRDAVNNVIFSVDSSSSPAVLCATGVRTKDGNAILSFPGIGAQFVGGAGINTTGDIAARSLATTADLRYGGRLQGPNGAIVLDSGNAFVGSGINLGSGGTIRTVDDAHARYVFASCYVIEGGFVGYPGPSSGTPPQVEIITVNTPSGTITLRFQGGIYIGH